MGGPNTINQSGIYGTEGAAAASNIPGARFREVKWIDASGKLWLFGGEAPAATPAQRAAGLGYLQNDMWTYQP
jgi:hypothetical protein